MSSLVVLMTKKQNKKKNKKKTTTKKKQKKKKTKKKKKKKNLHPWLSKMRPVKILKSLRGCIDVDATLYKRHVPARKASSGQQRL